MHTYRLTSNFHKEHSAFKQLKELANIVFVEIASGVYHLEKDRKGWYDNKKFCDTRDVVSSLNRRERVIVVNLQGDIYSNEDFLPEIKM